MHIFRKQIIIRNHRKSQEMILSDQNIIQGNIRNQGNCQLPDTKKAAQIIKEMASLDEQIARHQQKYDIQNKRIKFLKKESQELKERKEKMEKSSSEIRQQNEILKQKNKQLKAKLNDVKELFNGNYNANLKQGIMGIISIQPSLFSHKKISSVKIKNQTITQSTQEVDLTNTDIKDQDIESIKYFPKIKTLLLGDNQITSAGVIDIFQSIRHLKKLFLHNTLITDEGLQKIGFLGQLRCLDVRSNQLTDFSLEKISSCKKITQLSISNNLITDHGLIYLKDFPELNYLDMTSNKIGQTQFFEKNLKYLVNLPLTHLYLSHNKIEARFINALININGLKVLDLRFNRVEVNKKVSFKQSKPQSLQLFI